MQNRIALTFAAGIAAIAPTQSTFFAAPMGSARLDHALVAAKMAGLE